MRVLVHDFSGHPFQLQLSRALARRGHDVLHQYCADYVTGRGALARTTGDPPGFQVEPLSLGGEFAKYSVRKRVLQELAYGRLLAERVQAANADVTVTCNVPLLAHSVANRLLRRSGSRTVFWHQDIYSHAIGAAARAHLGFLGRPAGVVAERLERRIALDSAAVVPISPVFQPTLRRWGVSEERITVIPNWAALDELRVGPRDNPWARRHDLEGRPVALYSGTLGIKHDPDVLFRLAQRLDADLPAARLVVISEGKGRQQLQARQAATPTRSLVLLDFQPYDELSDVMATADVLVAVLERDASRYSVPSKVLSYLCAGRPVLALMPRDNGAAQTLLTSGAGVVVEPSDDAAAERALLALLGDDEDRKARGRAARRHAEAHFDVEAITERFEAVLDAAVSGLVPTLDHGAAG